MKKPTVHLIHGFVGAGKTTFAKQLEKETGAVRYSNDEWMIDRHGTNPPKDKYQDLYDAVTRDIETDAAQKVHAGQDVILDHGFWALKSRLKIIAWVKKHNATPKFYNVTCTEETARRRTLKRTADMPSGAMAIDEAAFNLFKTRFEPMQSSEEYVLIRTD